MHQFVRPITLILLATACAGCARGEGEAEAVAGEKAGIATLLTADAPTLGNIGPVTYAFAPERLTRAEIELAVPPANEATAWATKLIPSGRAARLGERACRYGEQTREQVCTAEKEVGLAMALLERPLADYRRAFAEAGIGVEELAPVSLGGCRGFSFAAEAEGSSITYRFHPAGGRTLLIARQFAGSARQPDADLSAVLESLTLPERPC